VSLVNNISICSATFILDWFCYAIDGTSSIVRLSLIPVRQHGTRYQTHCVTLITALTVSSVIYRHVFLVDIRHIVFQHIRVFLLMRCINLRFTYLLT